MYFVVSLSSDRSHLFHLFSSVLNCVVSSLIFCTRNSISWKEFETYFLSHEWDESKHTFVNRQTGSNHSNDRSATRQAARISTDEKTQAAQSIMNNGRSSVNNSATRTLEDDPNGIDGLRRELARLHMEFASLEIPISPSKNSNEHSISARTSPSLLSYSSASSSYVKTSPTSPRAPTSALSSSVISAAPVINVRDTARAPTRRNQPQPEDLAQTKLYSRIQMLEEQARIASEERAASNMMLKELAGRVDAAIRLVTDSIKASGSTRLENRVAKLENRLKIMETSIIKEQENTLRSLELLLRFKEK